MRMRAAIDLSPAVLPIQRPGESTSFRIGMRVLSSTNSGYVIYAIIKVPNHLLSIIILSIS